MERGLAENSLLAYGHDLELLLEHARERRRPVLRLKQAELTDFIGRLRARGLAPRSVARAVHALRGFYRYAVREDRIEADPMENLKAPRAFKALPRFLTTAQVEALLGAPDIGTPIGVRDRAILEVLYATGLRASELIGLKSRDVDLEVGLLTCFGKGRKERLVPMGRAARQWVRRYLDTARAGFARGRAVDRLFLSLRGGPLSYGDLYEAMPFDNRLVRLELSAAELRGVLAAHLASDAHGIVSLAGLRVRARCASANCLNCSRLRNSALTPPSRRIASRLSTTSSRASSVTSVCPQPACFNASFDTTLGSLLIRWTKTAACSGVRK